MGRTLAALALVAAGCRVSPAPPAGCGEDGSRSARLAGLIARDTAAAAAARPGRAALAAVVEPADGAWAAAGELLQKRVALRLLPAPPPACEDAPPFAPAQEAACPADVRLYPAGADALAALEGVIDAAERRLDVLMYLWGSDDIGWRIARRLAARAGPGLPVRVLVDSGGNLAQGEPKDAPPAAITAAVCWLAAQPHVTVVRNRNPGGRFDHRKLVLADGRLAWTGGRNFVGEAFEKNRDLSFTVAGPPVGELAAEFEASWREQGGAPTPPFPAPAVPPATTALARVVRTGPGQREIAREVYVALVGARRHVYLENPYLGDGRLLYLLAKARSRGADVRVVLPAESESGLFDRANRATAARLVSAGVRVYRYPGMSHVKAVAVDGTWAYTGTGNFDTLSFRRNHELGLAVVGGPVLAELEERLFRPAFRPEWEVTAPPDVGPAERLAELAAGLFG
jgi:cardiolipin synthase